MALRDPLHLTPLLALALAGCATTPVRTGTCTVGDSAAALLADPSAVPVGARVVAVAGHVVSCSCGARVTGGDMEARRIGGDDEGRSHGGDDEGRRLGGDAQARRLGGDAEGRRLGGDDEGRLSGGDTEGRHLGGDDEARHRGGDAETRQLGGGGQALVCSEAQPCQGYRLDGARDVVLIEHGKVTPLPDACVPW